MMSFSFQQVRKTHTPMELNLLTQPQFFYIGRRHHLIQGPLASYLIHHLL
jgi:hypothetical protein